MRKHWLQCLEEMKNASQLQQHVDESQWPMHVGGQWTHVDNNKK